MSEAMPGRPVRWCGVYRPHPAHEWTSLYEETFLCKPPDETAPEPS